MTPEASTGSPAFTSTRQPALGEAEGPDARAMPVTVVCQRNATPASVARRTSASRTSRARFDAGKSLPDSASSASGTPASSSKKTFCSRRGKLPSRRLTSCAGDALTKRSGAATDGSTLQRPPPLMRILRPPSAVFSKTVTRAPARAAVIAAISPAAPAPRMATVTLPRGPRPR
jgi:hypothetical protein